MSWRTLESDFLAHFETMESPIWVYSVSARVIVGPPYCSPAAHIASELQVKPLEKKPGVLPGSYKCTRYRSESMSIAIQVWCNLRKIN